MVPVPAQPQPPIDTAPAPFMPDGTPKKKNYLPWIFGILILAVIFATFYLILSGKFKSTPANLPTRENSASESSKKKPEGKNPLPVNLPVYPGSILTEASEDQPCGPQGEICPGTRYTWKISDDFNKIVSWYEQDKSNSGFILRGGGGVFNDSRNGQLTKNEESYWTIITNINPGTIIQVTIGSKESVTYSPKINPPISLTTPDTSNWKTYSLQGLTFKYPSDLGPSTSGNLVPLKQKDCQYSLDSQNCPVIITISSGDEFPNEGQSLLDFRVKQIVEISRDTIFGIRMVSGYSLTPVLNNKYEVVLVFPPVSVCDDICNWASVKKKDSNKVYFLWFRRDQDFLKEILSTLE